MFIGVMFIIDISMNMFILMTMITSSNIVIITTIILFIIVNKAGAVAPVEDGDIADGAALSFADTLAEVRTLLNIMLITATILLTIVLHLVY